MPIRNCIFCDCHLRPSAQKRPDSRTAEHVFSEVFRRISFHKTMNMYVGNVNGESPKLMYCPTLTALTMKGVCQKCNTGWMSRLENAVEPIMKRMFDKTDADQLSEPELAILARWTAKTAITLSYATPQQKPVPLQASHSLHPDYRGRARFGFFYSKMNWQGAQDEHEEVGLPNAGQAGNLRRERLRTEILRHQRPVTQRGDSCPRGLPERLHAANERADKDLHGSMVAEHVTIDRERFSR